VRACRELRCTDPLHTRAGGRLACQRMLELPGTVQSWQEPTGPALKGLQSAAGAAALLNAPAPNQPAGTSGASMRQWRQWRSSGAAQTWQTPTGPHVVHGPGTHGWVRQGGGGSWAGVLQRAGARGGW